jgi:Protein of unknown function (DUF2950)
MRANHMDLEALETFTVRLAFGFASTVLLMLLLLAFLLVAGFADSSFAQDTQPKRFSSAGEAANTLFEAAQKQDEQALEAILGAGRDVTSSGDEVNDKLEREQFTQKYQEMHRLVREADGNTILYLGAENWPFPIPLVLKNGEWYFDSARGKQEILFRRIGENETTAIDVCEEFAMAKNASAAKAASDDPISQFAETLVSAGAANADDKEPNPFHGYYFRIVTKNFATDVSGPRQEQERAEFGRIPGGVQVFRSDDLCSHPGWNRVREGPRTWHGKTGQDHNGPDHLELAPGGITLTAFSL